MATPCPIAVLPRRSRWRRASAMIEVWVGDASASRRAAASSTVSRSPGSASRPMRSADSRSESGMLGQGLTCRSAEVACDAGGALAAGGQLFLVLHQQPVELVGEQVDRRVHVDGAGIGVQGLAGNADRRLGPVIRL